MSTSKVLVRGGFTKVPLTEFDQNSPKVRIYYLKDLSPEKIREAKAALEKVKRNHKSYQIDLEKFEEEIQKKPYLLKHGKILELIKGAVTQTSDEAIIHQIKVSQRIRYIFEKAVTVGGNFTVSGKNAKIVINITVPPSKASEPSCDNFSLLLKESYLKNSNISLLVEARELPIEKIYTPLTVIGESEQREKREQLKQTQPGQVEDGLIPTHESFLEPTEPIELEKLFESQTLKGASQKRAFVYGSAGVGKSTLCQVIGYRWAQEKLWPQFTHIFLIRLRNLNEKFFRSGKKYIAADIIAQECGMKVAAVQKFLSDPNLLAHSLLLLDGEDEISSIAGSEDKEAYLHPAFQEMTRVFPHILATSRPQETSIPNVCSRLEILGFDPKRINNYVDNFFCDNQAKKAALQEQLKDPLIKSLAHIPINLEIFCSLINIGATLFPAGETPTMTSLYKTVTDWLYRRFLKDKMSMNVTEARKDPMPSEDPEVIKIAPILEQIAWKAMQQNTLYLGDKTITEVCRRYGFRNSTPVENLGVFRVKSGLGHFIHLTFQEYFAATYFARLYVERKRAEASECLREIKLNPRYSMTLSMVAGYLSSKNETALREFFEDLLSEPYDLAVGYELRLLAQCFRECVNPDVIPQYNGFIQQVANYIDINPVERLKVELLKVNIRLLESKEVGKVIINHLNDPKEKKSIASILERLANEKQVIPEEIISAFEKLFTEGKGQNAKYSDSFVRIVKGKKAVLSKEILQNLIEYFKSPKSWSANNISFAVLENAMQDEEWAELVFEGMITILKAKGSHFKSSIVDILGKVAVNGQKFAERAFDEIVETLKTQENDSNAFNSAANALGNLVKIEHKFAGRAWDELIAVLENQQSNFYAKRGTANALESIAETGLAGATERALNRFAFILGNQEMCFEAKAAVALALKNTARDRNAAVLQALQKFTQSLKSSTFDFSLITDKIEIYLIDLFEHDDTIKTFDEKKEIADSDLEKLNNEKTDLDDKILIVNLLENTIKRVKRQSGKALIELIRVIKDPKSNPFVKKFAEKALGEVANADVTVPAETFPALIEILEDQPEKQSDDKGYAANILGNVAKSGEKSADQAMEALAKILEQPAVASYARDMALQVLGGIASSKPLPEKVWKVIYSILQNKSFEIETKLRFIYGLVTTNTHTCNLPSEAIFMFIDMIKNPENYTRDINVKKGRFSVVKHLIVYSLTGYVINKHPLSEKILEELIEILVNQETDSQVFYDEHLKKIAGDQTILSEWSAKSAYPLLARVFFLTNRAFFYQNNNFYTTSKNQIVFLNSENKLDLPVLYKAIQEKVMDFISWRKSDSL